VSAQKDYPNRKAALELQHIRRPRVSLRPMLLPPKPRRIGEAHAARLPLLRSGAASQKPDQTTKRHPSENDAGDPDDE
jgi:hypothetical protein